jgi:hypothetical protein
MCNVFYVGSDSPLPTLKWDEKNPQYYLSDSEPDDGISIAKQHFTKKYVYYAGSHEGCGCGFIYGPEDDAKELEIRKKSVKGLVSTIEKALELSDTAELLVTWASRERQSPSRRLEMTPGQLLCDDFPLDEKDFVTFRKSKMSNQAL